MTRAAIRTKMVELITAGAAFGERVFPGRVTRFAPAQLPAACVYFEGEDVEAGRKGAAGRRLDCKAEFVVELVDTSTTEAALETALDTLSAAVELALTADNTLGATCKACDLVRVEFDRPEDDDADAFDGAAMLRFAVWYERTEGS